MRVTPKNIAIQWIKSDCIVGLCVELTSKNIGICRTIKLGRGLGILGQGLGCLWKTSQYIRLSPGNSEKHRTYCIDLIQVVLILKNIGLIGLLRIESGWWKASGVYCIDVQKHRTMLYCLVLTLKNIAKHRTNVRARVRGYWVRARVRDVGGREGEY